MRYCDDFVVLYATRRRAEESARRVAEILATLGLRLHPDKTRIVCLARGGQGFDFLGFHHHKVESWKYRGRFYLQRWPSERAMRSIRANIRDLTDRRRVGEHVDWAVANLNRVLRGWGAYFRYGNSARKFDAIDSYVHERLAILASKKHGLPGRNWKRRFTRAWLESSGSTASTGRCATGLRMPGGE